MPWSWRLHTREFWPARDLKKYPVLFLNRAHTFPAFTPLFMWTWCFSETRGVWYGANETWTPTTRGHMMFDIEGCSLEGGLKIDDDDEIEERQKRHRQFIQKEFAPKWDNTWANVKEELENHYQKLRDFDYDKATVWELYKQFKYAMGVVERMWELHFYILYGVYGAYWEFNDLIKEYAGLKENDPLLHKLTRGYDNQLFVMDRVIWDLRNRVLELGIDDIFRKTPASGVIPTLKKTARGREWLERYLHDFLIVKGYGWRQPRMMEFINPAWWEDPTPVIMFVQKYLMLPGSAETAFPLETIRPRLVEERKTAEQEILRRVRVAGYADMDWFSTVMKLAQMTSYVSEGHDWICECQCFSSFRYCMLKIGERLLKYGTISRPSDLFFFIPDELEVLICLPENYQVGDIAEERRQVWQAQKEYRSRPNFISREPMKPEETARYVIEARDPIVSLVSIGTLVMPRPETGAILFGNCGNTGEAEGTARVLINEGDVEKVLPGDILVCPATYASWSTIFPLIKGVVADGAGIAHHTCILGREYDIPVITNTGTATEMLNDGDHIKVEADEGLVFRPEQKVARGIKQR
jgi:pyruvate,water dikinase